MKRQILLLGLIGGILIAVLRWTEYQFLVIDHSIEIYGALTAITVISCLFYVVTWEILYFNFLPHFMDNYNAQVIAKIKASGASAAQIQTQIDQQNHFMQLYQNPFFNAAMTFIEPFPVGLLMTLISAALLRKKSPAQPAASPLTA